MTDRRKTALVLGMTTIFMFSPLAMVLTGYSIPMFQNLGFERGTLAPRLVWILAALVSGIVEEVFFRRWIMDMLMSGGVNPVIQVIISGVAFGLTHALWILA